MASSTLLVLAARRLPPGLLRELAGPCPTASDDPADLTGGHDHSIAVAERPAHVSIVCTGRNAPPALIEIADTVTEMNVVKHAYQQGIRHCRTRSGLMSAIFRTAGSLLANPQTGEAYLGEV